MLHLLQRNPSKVLTTFPLQIESSWQLSLLELPPCRNTVTPSSDSSDMYTSAVQSGPPLLMLHSHPTLVSKPLIPHPPILYLLPLPPHLCPLLLAALLRLLPPLLPLTLSGFFNGMLEVFEPGVLNYFTFFRPILSTLSASRNPILTPLPLSGFSALRSDHTHSRSGILSPDATNARGGIVTFVRQGLSFSKLSTSSFSSVDPYSDYVGINISLNNSSSVHFLMCTPPYSLLPNGWQNRLLFSLHSFLLQKSLHSGGLQLPSPPL